MPGSLDNVVLPEGVLDRIERHTIGLSEQATRLAAAGRHLRRGLLLFAKTGGHFELSPMAWRVARAFDGRRSLDDAVRA